MGTPNAQRQADYRQRHLKDVDGAGVRLQMVVDADCKLALERMARHTQTTQRAMLESLVREFQRELMAAMTPDQQDAYRDATR